MPRERHTTRSATRPDMRRTAPIAFPSARALALASLLALGLAACSTRSSGELTESLLLASDNRPELEMLLGHYRVGEERDAQLAAARSLVTGMSTAGTARYEWVDAQGRSTGFDALRFPDAAAARDSLAALLEREPRVRVARTAFARDVDTLLAEYLIPNVEDTFVALYERPWARQLSPEVMHAWVLPHRVGVEPTSPWRKECMQQWADLARRMDDPEDMAEAARLVLDDVPAWLAIDERFEFTPAQQSFTAMRRRGVGSRSDRANLAAYALRANAIPCAIDRAPLTSDGRPARWVTVLDAAGEGVAADAPAAPKVYRETYGGRPGSLAARLPLGTAIPEPLDSPNRVDVTAQYVPTGDLELRVQPSAGDRAVYLCVEGPEGLVAVAGLPVDPTGGSTTVRFPDVGTGYRYVPARYRDGRLEPFQAPVEF